jgi:hypothetical protein
MNRNEIVITDGIWHEFPAGLRWHLCRALKRKSAIVGSRVIDVASALLDHHLHRWQPSCHEVRRTSPALAHR